MSSYGFSNRHSISGIQFLLLPLMFFLTGCSDNPPTAPVSGKVMLEGKPLTSGKVLFLPIGGGQQALGSIQEDGSYQLTTFSENDGALIGDHHALIVKAKLQPSDEKKLNFRRNQSSPYQVKADAENNFEIEISAQGEWSRAK